MWVQHSNILFNFKAQVGIIDDELEWEYEYEYEYEWKEYRFTNLTQYYFRSSLVQT